LTVPGWAVENARLVDEGSVTRVGRSDHRFVFERTDARIADATLRAEIFVIGGRVSGYRPFVKVPEEWIRARAATTPQDVVALVLRAGTALTLVTLAALSFLRLARGRDLAVRPALLVALGFALWALIGEVNALPLLFRSYFTAVPPDSYVLTRVARLGVDLVQESLLAGAAAALVIGLWRRQVAPAVVPTVGRGVWAFDAALLSASMALTLLGLMAGVDALGLGTGAAAAAGVAWQAPVGAGTLFPAVASIAEARWVALRTLILFGGYLLVRGVVRRERWTLVASLLLPLISILTARSGPRALEAGLIVFGLIGLAIAARWFLRANLPAYFGAAIMLVLLVDSEGLLRHDHWWYGANGLALVGSMALALLAVLVGSLPVRGFGPDEATRPAGAPA
jgi:hypothetical protein